MCYPSSYGVIVINISPPLTHFCMCDIILVRCFIEYILTELLDDVGMLTIKNGFKIIKII